MDRNCQESTGVVLEYLGSNITSVTVVDRLNFLGPCELE